MNPKELMIGNFVYAKAYWGSKYELELVTVTEVNEDEVFHNACGLDGSCSCDIEPIELTEDWLNKFGFKTEISDSDDYYKSETWFLEYDGVTFVMCKEGLRLMYFDWQSEIKSIKYVHQLQNLYCILTSKELKINKI